jgi:hypothetical protein
LNGSVVVQFDVEQEQAAVPAEIVIPADLPTTELLLKANRISDASKTRVVRWVVWSVWTVMTVAALGFVARFGSNVPFWDEWNIVDFSTGAQPISFHWLWAPHNGHRILVPKLLLLGLYKISGTDFRAGMYFNVLALAGAAAALILGSMRGRGGNLSVTDAVFPLLLLHWGHYENLLWSWQTTMILPVVVVCGVLAIVVAYGLNPPLWLAALAVMGVVVLPLSGVPGLAYAPALAAWIAGMGAVAYRDGRRSRAIALWAAAGVTIALVALYFVKYTNTSGPVSVAQPLAVLKTAMRFAAGGLGPGVEKFWPITGAAATGVLLVTAAALALTATRHDRTPRPALALLLFVAGAACLVGAFASGRTGSRFVSRYSLLAAPMWCSAFFAWPLCVRRTGARWAQATLLTAATVVTPVNISAGLRYARDYHDRMEKFRADLLAGLSPGELVARHVATLCPCPWWGLPETGVEEAWGNLSQDDGFPVSKIVSFHDPIINSLRNLHDHRVGDFAQMRVDEPPVREIAPSLATGFTIAHVSAAGGAAVSADPAVFLTPARPLYVIGVRVRRPSRSPYTARAGAQVQCVQVFWRSPGEAAYMAPNRYVFFWEPGKDEQVVWIFQLVNQIALHVGDRDVQQRLGLDDIPLTLLLPESISGNGSPLANY